MLGLVTLLLLILLAAGAVLGTHMGSRWVLNKVPGVEVEQFHGRLGGEWQAERLTWQQGANRAVVDAPRMAWSPMCLLRMTLCIEELVVGDIDLQFPPTAEDDAPSEPFSLPDVKLPLELRIERIEIGELRLNDVEQLRSLQLRADWRKEGLDINALQVRRDDLSLDLTGRLQPNGEWPLELSGTAAIRSPDAQPWALMLAVNGELRDQLHLNVESQGYLDARLSGQLSPLTSELPAQLRMVVERFKATPELPDALRLDTLELSAEGDLDQGYRLVGDGRLQGEGGAVGITLNALVDAKHAEVEALQLDAGEGQRISLNGQADWQEGLTGEAELAWRDFPWRRLYPDVDEPPVALRTLDAQIQYDDGNYLGNFDAALTGPSGEFTLRSPVSGDLETVHLPQLELQAGLGRAAGNLSVGFADGIDWNTRLDMSELDPSFWVAELPGQLAGTLSSRGTMRDEQLQAEARLDLAGTLRQQPLKLQLEASGQGAAWNVPLVDLHLGDNRIQGSGRWAETLQANLELDLTRLAQLWPDLQGQLTGDLKLAGTPQAPGGTLTLEGSQVAFQQNRIEHLELAASLEQGERGELRLVADGLRAGDTELGRLQVTGDGSQQAHQADLSLQGPLLDLSLALDGGLRGEDWRGRLLRAELDAQGQQWALQRPASLERLANGRITFGAHCFGSGPATLCAENQRLLPDPQLRYRLRDFPLESLAEHMPDNLNWQGEVNADLSLDLPAAGPSGTIRIDAGPGTLRMRDGDRWLDFPYATLALNSELTPKRVDSHLRFEGGELGELDVRLQVDPSTEAKAISGSFFLSDFDLSVARPFVAQLERLNGQLNGRGELSGSLQAPQVNGELRLSDAEIAGSELPVSFEQLQVRALIEGERVRVDGDWRSGEQGRGEIAGTLNWTDALDLDMRISGSRLPVIVEPYAELEVEPDLRLELADDQLAVSGKVRVPRGDIQVRDLPPSTVRVSEDAVIVGTEAEDAQTPLAIRMDIDVEVGQDRLRFSGFGLTADLAGYLHIGDNLDARGELNLNNGRYRAYGQRLTIRRAQLLFTGVLSQPFLNIEAIRRIDSDNVIAGLRITGSAEQPRVDVFAEPAMSQEQALSYLVLGRPLGTDSGENNMLAQAALGLGLAGSASITGNVAQRLGIQDFQLDTEGSGTETSVVASGRLTDRLTLRYGVGVFESANTVALRYQLTKRIFLEAASGLASSLDVFYRRNF
ncbi:translocation/assembly module TamB [Pseudomonas sp. MTM4]|uniref:translocation/assembly module TamB domain-containing protein n=1 Tax=unclassified Pseudomonas TaxID=196821 RepID=UPI0018D22703|nr:MULTISPECIES: translocation/assembly module TamB domain-containing protein [unclassified Pseudomonas]MBC8648634.1 translocation/assembly module TamB [Pseudomonas sp. MT4]QXY94054.1 translocation/assembly module TamB [Pseudomonas sp. MTM4]